MSGEEAYQKLKNDPEFLHKLAEILKPEIALIVLDEFKKFGDELKKVNDNLTKLTERVDSLEKRVEKLENRVEKLEKQQEKMIKQQERTNKELRYLRRAIENLAISIEEEAIEFLTHKLKKEYNLNVKVRSFEIENVVQFDIFAEIDDKLILGEVKARAGVRAVEQLENAIKKLLKAKPEFQNKKIIPVIYAKRYTEELIETCEKKGIYLTSGFVDLTPLKLN